MKSSRQSGFTLVEMSIVLTVIALIVGGIFGATALLNTLKLRQIGSEATEIQTALRTFKDRYGYLPGDFPNATQVWGAADADAATCKTTDSTGKISTCNGNGDGKVAGTHATNLFYKGSEDYEMFRAWQQLNNAGLYSANVSGMTGAGSTRDVKIGVNVPRSKAVSEAGWSFLSVNPRGANSNCSGGTVGSRKYSYCYLDDAIMMASVVAAHGAASYAEYVSASNIVKFGNILLFGADESAHLNGRSVLHPSDAQAVDSKFDDGKPDTGKIIGVNDGRNLFYSITPPCSTTDSNNIMIYRGNYVPDVSDSTVKGCALMWVDAF